jgi:choline/glycine/proline betaine transport protein
MNSIATGNRANSPKWQNAFWGVLLALISMSLLYVGGLKSLQTMTLVAALPFGAIMVLLCFCLWKALRADQTYFSSTLPYGSRNWNGEHWQEHLTQILTFSQKKDIKRFFAERVRPAFEKLQAEMAKNNIDAHILEGQNGPISMELQIPHDKIWNFRYGVTTEVQAVSDYIADEDNTPDIDSNKQYVPVTYYTDGRTGNNIQYLSKDEIIIDVLREYERYINLVSDENNAMLFIDKKKYRQH